MCKGVTYKWRIKRSGIITNYKWSCDNVNRTIAGSRIARTKENRTIKKSVVEGTVLTRDISIIARDNVDSFVDDNQKARGNIGMI